MPSRTVLDDWLRAESVASDLVFGCIRWQKVLGVPDGKLEAAFFLKCYHYDQYIKNNDQVEVVLTPHLPPAEKWEGPHDDGYFRVNFVTYSMLPRNWDFDKDPSRRLNLLNASL